MGSDSIAAFRPGVVATKCTAVATAVDALVETIADLRSAEGLAERTALAELAPRLAELLARARIAEQSLLRRSEVSASAKVPTQQAPPIASLAEPTVHASIAEIMASRGAAAPLQLRSWLRDSVHDDACVEPEGESSASDSTDDSAADADDPTEKPTTPAAESYEIVPPGKLLDALLKEIGCRATLQGTASTMPISALVPMLAMSRKSGVLHFRCSDERLRFEFAAGAIVATSSDHSPTDQLLGELLVARGALSASRRSELVTLAKESESTLGAIALERGEITVDQLVDALRRQVAARFERVYDDSDVAYAFVAAETSAGDGRIRVNPRELLFDSARKTDEARRRDAADG